MKPSHHLRGLPAGTRLHVRSPRRTNSVAGRRLRWLLAAWHDRHGVVYFTGSGFSTNRADAALLPSQQAAAVSGRRLMLNIRFPELAVAREDEPAANIARELGHPL